VAAVSELNTTFRYLSAVRRFLHAEITNGRLFFYKARHVNVFSSIRFEQVTFLNLGKTSHSADWIRHILIEDGKM
jgi:hypothetical protein